MNYQFTEKRLKGFKRDSKRQGNNVLLFLTALVAIFLVLEFLKYVDQPEKKLCLDAADVNSGSQHYNVYYSDCKKVKTNT